MPHAFSDFGKAANDLLNDTYNYDQTYQVKIKSSDGVSCDLKSSIETGASKSLSCKSSFDLLGGKVDLKFDGSGKTTTDVNFSDVGIDGLSAKISAAGTLTQFDRDSVATKFTYNTASLNSQTTAKVSGVISTNAVFDVAGVTIGAEAKLNATEAKLESYGAALGYGTGDLTAAASFTDNFSKLSASGFYKIDDSTNFALSASTALSGEDKSGPSVSVGVSKSNDGKTVKAKVDSAGVFSFAFKQAVRDNMNLAISASVDTGKLADGAKLGINVVSEL